MTDSLKFGTSGLRGLAVDLLGSPSARYTAAFLKYLSDNDKIAAGSEILVARDLRESSQAIAGAVVGAILEAGFAPVDCGEVPTPALALFARKHNAPAIMVTGSHIPADRNGLKFYIAADEISKADEAGILESLESVGAVGVTSALARPAPEARQDYLDRYVGAFADAGLERLKVGVFQHSAVGRDDLVTILEALGATVVPVGRSDHFIPIDTEALSAADAVQAREWAASHQLDAIVSTDGDADRPLVADEAGNFIRGDVLGILTARFLRADAVITPVTSNSSIECLGAFDRVIRTKVGSPFVIAGMEEARAAGARIIVGFEANGGVLLGSDATIGIHEIGALPTRDAMLPILCTLAAAQAADMLLSEIVATLPPRIARSDRLEHVPQERTAALLALLAKPDEAARYFAEAGQVASVSTLDGLRFILGSGEVIHYRGSGNAPELRCYTEAGTAERADALLAWGLKAAEQVVR